MSMDFSIKPVGAPVAPTVAPPVSQAADDAIATELPASQSVTAAAAGAAVPGNPQSANADLSSQVVIDQAAASIVYEIVNNRTDVVVEQFPDEGVLRRRAYFHTLDLTKGAPARPLATDRTA